jgi:hypothetical protein
METFGKFFTGTFGVVLALTLCGLCLVVGFIGFCLVSYGGIIAIGTLTPVP